MGNFCEFCGTRLENGALCTCPEAVSDRQATAAPVVEPPVTPVPEPPAAPAPQAVQTEPSYISEVPPPVPYTPPAQTPAPQYVPVQAAPPPPPNVQASPPYAPTSAPPQYAPTATPQEQPTASAGGGYAPQYQQPGAYSPGGQTPPAYTPAPGGYPSSPAPGGTPQFVAQTRQVAGQVGKEAGALLGDFMKSPVDIAAQRKLSLPLGITLLTVAALCKTFLMDRMVRVAMVLMGNLVETAAGGGGGFGRMISSSVSDFEMEFSTYLLIFVVMAVQSGIFMLLAYLSPKLQKSETPSVAWQDAVSTVGMSSIPWMVASVAAALLLTLLSYSGMSIYLAIALLTAATALSIGLCEAGMRRYVASDSRRLVAIAVTYGLQAVVVSYALVQIIF